MAGGGKEYTLTFLLKAAADSSYQAAFSKAKQELNDYQKQIQANNTLLKDISAYERQEKAVQRAAETLSQKTAALEKAKAAATAAGNADEKLNAAQTKAQAAVKTATERLNQQEQKLKTQGDALKEAGVNTGNLTTEQERLAKSSQELKQKQEELADSQNQWIQQLAEMEAVAAEAYSVIQVADKLADAWKACVDAGSGFEAAMSGVRAVTGLTKDEMAEVTAVAKQLGADTVYTATEIANAMEYMGLAGWNATEIVEGIPAVVNLTAAAGEDLSRVSDIVTDSMQALGYTTADTTHFCDVLANTVTNANTTVDLMGDTLKYVSSTAGVLGYSIEDVSTAIAAMANNGIKGSQNGTTLRNILANLAAPTDDAAAALDRLGVSLTDSNGETLSLNSVITQLRSSFSELTAVEQTKYATDIAGKRAMAGLLAIVNTSQEEYDALAETIRDCDGAAEEMAAVRMDNMAGSVEILSGAWDALKTSIGEAYLDGLSAGAEELAVLVDEAAEFASANQQVVIGATAAAGTMGLLAVGITGVTTATKLFHAVFAGSALANPALWGAAAAVAAIVGVGAAIVDLAANAKDAHERLAELQGQMDELEDQEALINEYYELKESLNETGISAETLTARENELAEIEAELKEMFPGMLGGIDSESEAWDVQTKAIYDNIEAKRILAAADAAGDVGEIAYDFATAQHEYASATQEAATAQANLNEAANAVDTSEAIAQIEAMKVAVQEDIDTGTLEVSVEGTGDYANRIKAIADYASKVSGGEVTFGNLADVDNWLETYEDGTYDATEATKHWANELVNANERASGAKETIDETAKSLRLALESGLLNADDLQTYSISLEELGVTSDYVWGRIHSGVMSYQEAVETYGVQAMDDMIYSLDNLGNSQDSVSEATAKATNATTSSYKEYAKAVGALQAVGSETLTAEQAAVAFGLSVDTLNEMLEAQESYESNVAGAVASVKAGYMDAEEAASTFGVTLEAMDAYEAEQELELLNGALDELEEAYQSAYESALSSIQGQGSLLEGLSLDADRTKLTVSDALSNMKEIESYWSTYYSNMELLQGYGLSTDFLTRFCDETSDGVANAQDLANELGSLDSATVQAKVEEINTQFQNMAKQEDITATATADMQTQYTTMAEAIEGRMQELQSETEQNISAMVTSMNKSGQAYSNGYATANSYVLGIRSQISAARAAAQDLAAAGTPSRSSGKYTGGKAAGGFTSGPELAGEDPRYPVEAVISFNPAYHDQNVEYVKRAAAMLGIDAGDTGNSVDWSGYSFGGFTDYGTELLNNWSGRVAKATVTEAPIYMGSNGNVGGTVNVTYTPNVQVNRNTTRSEILSMLQSYDEQLADKIESTIRDMNWQERRTAFA